jgi:hypothetical protein
VALLETYLTEQGLSEHEMDNWLLSQNKGTSSKTAVAPPLRNRSVRSTSTPMECEETPAFVHQVEPNANKDWLLHTVGTLSSIAAGAGPEKSYIGSTSGHSIAFMMQSLDSFPVETAAIPTQQVNWTETTAIIEGTSEVDFCEKVRSTDRATAELLFKTYMLHAQARYPIINVGKSLQVLARGSAANERNDRCILNFVFAIGARFLETSGNKRPFGAEVFCFRSDLKSSSS